MCRTQCRSLARASEIRITWVCTALSQQTTSLLFSPNLVLQEHILQRRKPRRGVGEGEDWPRLPVANVVVVPETKAKSSDPQLHPSLSPSGLTARPPSVWVSLRHSYFSFPSCFPASLVYFSSPLEHSSGSQLWVIPRRGPWQCLKIVLVVTREALSSSQEGKEGEST